MILHIAYEIILLQLVLDTESFSYGPVSGSYFSGVSDRDIMVAAVYGNALCDASLTCPVFLNSFYRNDVGPNDVQTSGNFLSLIKMILSNIYICISVFRVKCNLVLYYKYIIVQY